MRLLRVAPVVLGGGLLAGGFYLLLVDTTSLPELYVLGSVALAGGVVFELSREQGFVEARVIPRWLGPVWRVVIKAPGDVLRLCSEAVLQLVKPRGARGSFRAVPFAATEDAPAAAGRRALTEWLGSIAPNTIIVGVDTERGLLLVHQLRRQGHGDELDPLRLG